MIDWVDVALERWGDYYRDGRDNGLGYPSCSIEARVFTGGGGKPAAADVPEVIAFMEKVVLSMDVEMRAVVEAAYMSSDNRYDQARRLSSVLKRKISRQRMADQLCQAHQYIEGYSRGSNINLKKY